METIDIQAGDIFEIKLEKSYGYTYMKYLYAPYDRIQSGWTMMPLYVYASKPLEMNSIDVNTPFFNNILGHGAIKFRGKYKQKIIGRTNDGLDWEPFVTRHSRFSLTRPFDAKEKWWILKNGKHHLCEYLPFEKIKHLSLGFSTGITQWTTILTMLWIRRNGENIKDYYTEEEFKNNMWKEFEYDYASEVVFYPELDPQYWNKPIA